MFRALNRITNTEIILLQPRRQREVAGLRALDRQDLLVCPGCMQPVRLKTGETRRWHFAHKHLQNCPFESASPAVLACRAVLYAWLVLQFGEAQVQVEHLVPGLPRPVDCWLPAEEGAKAYWVFDTRLRPDAREKLRAALALPEVRVNWVFHQEMQHREPEILGEPGQIYLTTTEREFLQGSPFDLTTSPVAAVPGGSLHYLDPEKEILTSWRSLQRRHATQFHTGRSYTTPLAQVAAFGEGGDFVHPGEVERLALLQQAIRERQETRVAARRIFASQQRRTRQVESRLPESSPVSQAPGRLSAPSHLASASSGLEAGPRKATTASFGVTSSRIEAVCMLCGQFTRDWWYLDLATGLCKCRECLEKTG